MSGMWVVAGVPCGGRKITRQVANINLPFGRCLSGKCGKIPLLEQESQPSTDLHAPDYQVKDGILADVAPTLLDMLGVPKPPQMTGTSLLVRK